MHFDCELTSSVLRTELCLLIDPASSYIEALTVNMTVFGDRAFKQVIKVKWGHIGETLVQQLSSFYEKRKSYQEWADTKERPRKDTGRR